MSALYAYMIDSSISVLIITHWWQELSSSSFFYSIVIFKSYKTAYFSESKATDHCEHASIQHGRGMISYNFTSFELDFGEKTSVWSKTNIIFGISVENCVDSYIFEIFLRLFVFQWKMGLVLPLRVLKKIIFLRMVILLFSLLSFCSCKYFQASNTSLHKTNSVFDENDFFEDPQGE
jgi:hypothetical protein